MIPLPESPSTISVTARSYARAWRALGSAAAIAVAIAGAGVLRAQQPGRNVNMVSGTSLPDGDPFLQRQNEPSGAVSSRNPLTLFAGANDYRTVDLPGLPNTGD